MHQEGKMDRKDLGCGKQYLQLSMGKGDKIYRKTIGLEVVKRAAEKSTGLPKLRNSTLWRCRPPPKRKKNLLAPLM
jgi:hypothetical protein